VKAKGGLDDVEFGGFLEKVSKRLGKVFKTPCASAFGLPNSF